MRTRLRAVTLLAAATGAATLAACDRVQGGGTKLATVDSVAALSQRLARRSRASSSATR
jgi:hypothetical protein